MREPADINETRQQNRPTDINETRVERDRPADLRQARDERARDERAQLDANRDPNRPDMRGTTAPARMAEPRMGEDRVNITDERRQGMLRSSGTDSEPTALFGEDEASGFRDRWETVQAEFVDDPRHAVEDADRLVSEAIQRLSKVFGEERTNLEQQWKRGDNVSTEDLRLALTKYRSFFERLVAA